MTYFGEYGGRVLRKIQTDKPYLPGALITPEEAMQWPLANRKALYNTHKVEWYGPPAGEIEQKSAPKGTSKVEFKEKEFKKKESKETLDDKKLATDKEEKLVKKGGRTKGKK